MRRPLFPRQGLLMGVWHLVTVLGLLVVPSWLILGEPAWALELGRSAHVLGLAAAYVGGVIILRLRYGAARPPLSAPFLIGALALGCVFGAVVLTRVYYSRSIVVIGGLGVLAFLVLPTVAEHLARLSRWTQWFRRRFAFAGTLRFRVGLAAFLGIVCAAVLTQTVVEARSRTPMVTAETINTSHNSLTAVVYDHFVAPTESLGGGIDQFGDGYLLATGDGDLYHLEWEAGTDSLSVASLASRIPINADEFVQDGGAHVERRIFRVADLLVRSEGDGFRLFASHHYWKRDARCFVVRISTATAFPAQTSESVARTGTISNSTGDRKIEVSPWKTYYETHPCLPLKDHDAGVPFAGRQLGGRMVLTASGRLLLTVGDHEFDGWNGHEALSQDPSADYGKILAIREDGTAETFSLGHRNPQGLHMDDSGAIWSTEHGPEGGDELNRIVEGGNYGWPFVTHGTAYGDVVWPLATEDQAVRDFRAPLHAWVPSIGVSSLISVVHPAYPLWRGDLLVSSMKAQTLYRVRLEGNRVAYVEPITVGKRIRDLVMGPDGRLVLWTDETSIVSVRPADPSENGEVVFRRCTGCHEDGGGGTRGIGPSLDGVYGRDIASQEDFLYSESLRSMGGRWDRDRLDDFLADPVGFAPGTNMRVPGVVDREEREALIRYLKKNSEWNR